MNGKIVETNLNNNVGEAVEAEITQTDSSIVNEESNTIESKYAKLTESKLPCPIRLRTKNGGGILQTAINLKTYKKEYYRDYNKMKTERPYREKEVNLPVSQYGQTFGSVWNLFVYLHENCGYEIIRKK